MRWCVCLLAVLFGAGAVCAGDLRVDPPAVTLRLPHATQQLVVSDMSNGRATNDRTATATFKSSNPKVASVSSTGGVTATGGGTATVSATVGGRTSTMTVTVTGMKVKSGWDFDPARHPHAHPHGL